MIATQRLGVILFIYMNIECDSHHGGCQHWEREELAQHTIVHVERCLRQVTTTMVVQTVYAAYLGILRRLVNVQRRQ